MSPNSSLFFWVFNFQLNPFIESNDFLLYWVLIQEPFKEFTSAELGLSQAKLHHSGRTSLYYCKDSTSVAKLLKSGRYQK
jgi:hypothetical protein